MNNRDLPFCFVLIVVCPFSYYGLMDCNEKCDNCRSANHLNRSVCSRPGTCVGGCQEGWKDPICNAGKPHVKLAGPAKSTAFEEIRNSLAFH